MTRLITGILIVAFGTFMVVSPEKNGQSEVLTTIVLGLSIIAVGGTLMYFGGRYLRRRRPGDPLSTFVQAPLVLMFIGVNGLAASCGVGLYRGEQFGTYGWLLQVIVSLLFFIGGGYWQVTRSW
ncbi:MAG: hypothetical protein HY699_16965 [Deltaproteobacteria bacterium]|nr:hypothetical protein [Deltaproteobacteria bacterium]